MRLLLFLLTAAFSLSSCATILNSPYQKVAIKTSSKNEVLVNGKKTETKKGKHKIKRDLRPKQITFKRDGYKSERIAIMPYKRAFLYYVSWVPFIVTLAPFGDVGPKSYDYDKEVQGGLNMLKIPHRKPDEKYIQLRNVAVEVSKKDINYNFYPSYRRHLMDKPQKNKSNPAAESVELENTIFSAMLNEMLVFSGYIDTSGLALTNSYLNNLFLNATISGYTLNFVTQNRPGNQNYFANDGIMYIDLEVNWEVQNSYNEVIYEKSLNTQSGQYVVTFSILNSKAQMEEPLKRSIKDALETSLLKFIYSSKVQELLIDEVEEEEVKQMPTLTLPKSDAYVSNLNEAIASSVTVKSSKGHGSGFIISPEGHIITNYHVVTEGQENLWVILNDKSKYVVKILRTNKTADLALLKIDKQGLLPFKISQSEEFTIAQDVYAVGTPNAEDLSQTVSKGIISGVRTPEEGIQLIQTDASVNPGNSGGALVDKQGLVLGVITSKLHGYGIEGVAFGIPAYEILRQLNLQ